MKDETTVDTAAKYPHIDLSPFTGRHFMLPSGEVVQLKGSDVSGTDQLVLHFSDKTRVMKDQNEYRKFWNSLRNPSPGQVAGSEPMTPTVQKAPLQLSCISEAGLETIGDTLLSTILDIQNGTASPEKVKMLKDLTGEISSMINAETNARKLFGK